MCLGARVAQSLSLELLFHFFIAFHARNPNLWKCHLTSAQASSVCLCPRSLRLTAPANNKKQRAADSEPADSCQATRVVVLRERDLSALIELVRLALRRCRGRRTQLSEAWHSAGPEPAPFNLPLHCFPRQDLLQRSVFAVTNELTNEAVSVYWTNGEAATHLEGERWVSFGLRGAPLISLAQMSTPLHTNTDFLVLIESTPPPPLSITGWDGVRQIKSSAAAQPFAHRGQTAGSPQLSVTGR